MVILPGVIQSASDAAESLAAGVEPDAHPVRVAARAATRTTAVRASGRERDMKTPVLGEPPNECCGVGESPSPPCPCDGAPDGTLLHGLHQLRGSGASATQTPTSSTHAQIERGLERAVRSSALAEVLEHLALLRGQPVVEFLASGRVDGAAEGGTLRAPVSIAFEPRMPASALS